MSRSVRTSVAVSCLLVLCARTTAAQEWWKPYSPPCVERENVFEFTEKPAVRVVGKDRYEITFAVKGYCDVTVAIVDPDPAKELVKGRGIVVRHLASGVLGPNAPPPFQKNSLKQTLYWNGKDDLDLYVKEPGKLRVRVMLGLKPVFDKRLGGTSPYNLPGYVMGLAVAPDGAFVFNKEHSPGFQHVTIRKFDRDGNYLCTLVPPPADLPESKLGGMGFVEYEPGRKALHGPDVTQSIAHNACYMTPLDAQRVIDCQPVVVGKRLVFANTGETRGSPGSFLHYIYTDGSTDVTGIDGVPLIKGLHHNSPRLATSPDGTKIYIIGAHARTSTFPPGRPATCIYVRSLDGEMPAEVWVGRPNTPGSTDQQFGDAQGIDCDAEGRVYVSDTPNNRVQIFSPDGKHLKTITADRPAMICVHKKTGAVYVQHQFREEGRSKPRLTKFRAFPDLREELYADDIEGWMALDSWSPKPRLWVAMIIPSDRGKRGDPRTSVTIWEEQDGRLAKLRDFEEEARKEPGWFTKWKATGSLSDSKSVCDPLREKLYYANTHVFDLPTGKYEGWWRHPGTIDDIAFDKRGYLHAHFNPCFFMQGVGRFDPDRKTLDREGAFIYPECPYDYGIEKGNLRGVLPVRDQTGAKGFQDGLGVNMRGDIAVQSNIYYVPKMEDEARDYALQGSKATTQSGIYNEEGLSYERFVRSIQDAQKRGDEVFFIRRRPGISLAGGTLWTFDSTGELRKECAVIAGDVMAGVQINEDRAAYFLSARPRVYGDKTFLSAKAGRFGKPEKPEWPFTGTLIKTQPDAHCRILYRGAPVPMDEMPARPPDLAAIDFPNDQRDNPGTFAWVEGAEWLYAGASPIANSGCSCPSSRFHLDWYKRTYVPESYRHSFAILDTNGNLIMHVGRYGNFDNAPGGPKGCKPGETDIGMTAVRYIGGTDNYLAFEDWGERLVVLKLNYHVEATTPIAGQ